MSRQSYEFTSESVSEGHPDKVSDRISDEIVDLYFREALKEGMDPWQVRVAAETLTTTNKVVIAGETRGPSSITPDRIEALAREAIKDIGYEQDGFHWKHADIDVLLHPQSVDIAQGVDSGTGLHIEEGAGDQGIMFGYASLDVPGALMPAPVHYSHKILARLAKARKEEGQDWLGPDSKSQVTVRYHNGRPVEATAIVLSTQHLDASLDSKAIAERVKPYIEEVLPSGWITDNTIFHINPTGKFVIGGPDGDAGLTGRKIIVDTYGGMAPHGGGAFSGKDPTKVDRSAAYATRYLAKNLVAAGIAPWVEIQVSYAIGVAAPTSIYVNVDDNNPIKGDKIETIIRQVMDLTPRGIRKHLALNKPIYAPTAAYGHFGRDVGPKGEFSWEKTDLVDEIRARLLSENPKDLTCVAVIAGAHGVHGAVKVKSFTEVPADFVTYGPLLGEDGQVVLTPKNPRPVGKAFTMRSPEITTRELAESLKGTKLYVPRAALPEPEEENFYYADLIGLEVKSTQGKRVGTVRSVQDFGAGDMLEIQPMKSAEKQTSFFHPFTKVAVPKIDLKARRLVIHIEEAVIGRAPSGEDSETI